MRSVHRRQRHGLVVCLLLSALTVSCAGAGSLLGVSGTTAKNVAFDAYRTWAWLEPKGEAPKPDWDKRIRSAVAAQLATRGFQRAEGPPDIQVSYQSALRDSVAVDTSAYNWAADAGASGPEKIHPVTILVDVVDAHKKTLVWRGEAKGNLTEESLPEEKLQALDDAIERMFATFPVPSR